MTTTDFTPTGEQELARDLFATGKDLVVNAGAGTGKTSTLALVAASTNRRGRYVAFNKSIAVEAGAKMPGNVEASTLHSIAFRSHGRRMKHRLDAPRMSPDRTARELGLDPITVQVADQAKVMQPGWLAGHVMRAVTAFCHSAAPEPTVRHFRYIDGIDMPAPGGRRTYANNDEIARALLPAVRKAWDDLCDPNGRLRYDHSCYVKQYALDGGTIPAEFVLHDEAQDANPVTLQILANGHGQQVVHVGDSYQAIYGWRGAIDAMEQARGTGAEVAWLTQSFRFGPAIAQLANGVLDLIDGELRLVGTPTIPSRLDEVEQPDAILCRTNGAAVQQVMSFQRDGLRPHLIGGGRDIVDFAKAALLLQDGKPTSHPELACFTSWGEVQAYVDQDEQGDELRMLVRLVDNYGADDIIDALLRMPREDQADLVISTAHKAKGREWPQVRLARDFAFDPAADGLPPAEELRLLYMAVTRASHVIDLGGCREAFQELGLVPEADDEHDGEGEGEPAAT